MIALGRPRGMVFRHFRRPTRNEFDEKVVNPGGGNDERQRRDSFLGCNGRKTATAAQNH
jgi:hypothetical protein